MFECFMTDQGKVRNHNEDAGGIFTSEFGQSLAIVADGMGGHRAGDVASQLAVSVLHNKWKEAADFNKPDDAEEWLKHSVIEVNGQIQEHAKQNEECHGMGTTLVAAICTDGFATIAHIGDSRCYLANSFGFKQITEDHSLVNELVRSGQITSEQAEHHPRKNVLTKALGTDEEIIPDILTITFDQDDRLLLCSDGLSNKVHDEEIEKMAEFNGEWQEFCQSLVDIANERGGEDNITLAVIHNSHSELKEGAD
ncbi:Stp1/IreP family PP2C-type Ser/Thr phosphatase [Halobacillus shinanisalinarum]|uniref:Stp1/IreP family PP2C-type Ser/Thr phosphatase n=1 Tax=Halobacillus shinanisalinarum TaxID=2932258 RepID=A0ABY4GYI6_9BACI|nr:Stp1/IreP family PP2C-type Ser/Thr phosphatase [Halobacillus shinanisalinarum]UOQ93173.1 Stp1/IreP family PP2C-type Ser/Thr phosphatase [Halobacillus shinanisalinarum]